MPRSIAKPPPAMVTVTPANDRVMPVNSPYTRSGVLVLRRWNDDSFGNDATSSSRICGHFASQDGTEWTCYAQPSMVGFGSGRANWFSGSYSTIVQVSDTAEIDWSSVTLTGLRPRYPVRVANRPAPSNWLENGSCAVVEDTTTRRRVAIQEESGGDYLRTLTQDSRGVLSSDSNMVKFRWVVAKNDGTIVEGTVPEFFSYAPWYYDSWSADTAEGWLVVSSSPTTDYASAVDAQICAWWWYIGADGDASIRVRVPEFDWPGGMGGATPTIYLWASELTEQTDPYPLTGDYWASSTWTKIADLTYPGAGNDYNVVHTGINLTAGKPYVFRLTDNGASGGWEAGAATTVVGWTVTHCPSAFNRPPPWDIMSEDGMIPGGVIDLGF